MKNTSDTIKSLGICTGIAVVALALMVVLPLGVSHAQNATSTSATSTATSTTDTSTSTTSTGTSSVMVAPLISLITVTPSSTGATVGWTTDVAANSHVMYGLTSNYTSSTTLNTNLATSHSVVLSNLNPNTLYNFQIHSANASGTLATSTNMTFITLMGTSTTGTTTTPTTTPNIFDLQSQINALQTQLDNLKMQVLILLGLGGNTGGTGGTGTTTSQMGHITPTNISVMGGSSIDFNGRGFGHEENVAVVSNGVTVTTAHADGGGNFTTGSLRVPMTMGPKTYTFIGQNSGIMGSATITIQ